MSVLQSFRDLARYHVLTSVAVLSALAAGPALAVDQVNSTDQTTIVNVGAGNNFINSARISVAAGHAVITNGGSFNNLASGSITSAASDAIHLNGTTTSFVNAGEISSSSSLNTVYSYDNVTSFTNLAGGRITNTVGAAVGIGGTTGHFLNEGTITAAQTGVFFSDVTNLITNRGTIDGGTGSGILVDNGGNTNIVNSGTIRGFLSIQLNNATNNRLTLLTGSRLFGNINFGNGTDALDFSGFYGTAVINAINFNPTAGDAVIAGDRAHVRTIAGGNTTFTIFDQTGASSMGNVTSGVVGGIQTAIANELGGFSAGNVMDANAVSGYVAEPRETSAQEAANEAVLSQLDVSNPSAGKVWGTVFGGVSGDAAPVALSNIYGGLVAGTHFQLDASTRLGGLVGYSMSKFNVANGQQVIDSQTGVLGVYGKTDLGMLELNYALLGGGSGHTSTRKVVVGAAEENATASFASWFINPSVGIAVPVMSDDTSEVNIAASASYIYGGVGSYTERSANFTATVGAMPISVFEARLELNGEKIVGQTSNGDIRLRGKVGVLAQANLGSSNIPLSLNGTTTTFANPGTTTYGAYAGGGISADIGHGLVLDAGLDFTVRADGNNSGAGKMSLIGSF